LIRDLGSANGTKVNSARVEGDDFELRANDHLEVGPLAFVVRIEGQPARPCGEEEALALLMEIGDEKLAGPADTVVDALGENPTHADLRGMPYRPSKPGEEKTPVNSAEAARALLEQYRQLKKSKKT
jgi:hypothetical protein